MILVIVIGLVIGICIGFAFNITFPTVYSFYITMALLAALDSVIGAARAHMEEKYDSLVFGTGFICNALLAAVLTWIGDKLGIPLYYAAILVFGGRLFNNLAVMRRMAIDRYRNKDNKM
ncbi:MAG: small basic family protein [Firmicutes bacterium]|nr:small basic family protein [Bacillota bacterium]